MLKMLRLVTVLLQLSLLLEACWMLPENSLKRVYGYTMLLLSSLTLEFKGIHPSTVAEAFKKAAEKSVEFLTEMSIKLDLGDRESLLKSAITSLNSKVAPAPFFLKMLT
jgi:hypothetical protein